MPKKQKPTKKPAITADRGEQDTYDLALGYLREQILSVIDGSAAKTKHDPAYRVATLTRMVAQVDAERRKARAAENKKLERITRPLAIAWLRTLDKEERRSITREIAAMDAEGSILA
jgi:hypothetical protein